jgi:hypothetical protein
MPTVICDMRLTWKQLEMRMANPVWKPSNLIHEPTDAAYTVFVPRLKIDIPSLQKRMDGQRYRMYGRFEYTRLKYTTRVMFLGALFVFEVMAERVQLVANSC